jgi:hypothetical protein
MANETNAVNVVSVSLDKFEAKNTENLTLNNEINSLRETVAGLKGQVELERVLRGKAEEEAEKNKQTIWVRKDRWLNPTNGVQFDINSPELITILKEATDKTLKEQVETLQESNKQYLADIEDMRFNNDRDITRMSQDHLLKVDSIEDKYTKKVKNLQDEISDLKKDYENLKLDKAEEILEKERIAEIEKLNKEIAELKGKQEVIEHSGFLYWLFKKYIDRKADELVMDREWRTNRNINRVDESSAIKKARKFLQSFTSLSKSSNDCCEPKVCRESYPTSSYEWISRPW